MRVFASIATAPLRRLARVAPRTSAALLAFAVLASCDLNPNKEACTMSIAPTTISIPVNGQITVNGTAFDCDGNSIKNKTINFQSANTSVATVTVTGQVIGVGVGQTTISAVANGKSASASVTVTPETAASVTVAPGTVTLRVGNVRSFAATARNNTGTVITGRTFRWSSSNSAIAAIDQSGTLTATTAGNIVVTADVDGAIGTANVTITPVPLQSCSLAPTSQKLTVTAQVQPTITIRDTANNLVPANTRPVTWTSDNEIVATVTNTGVITARKAGTAIVKAASTEYPSVQCQMSIEVVDPRIFTAQIQPRVGSLRIGIPRQLAAVLYDSLNQVIPPGRPVTWTSVTPSIAIVTATGLVTGSSIGTARIAINAEGARDTVNFSVTQIPVTNIRVTPIASSVIQGATVQLSATVEDSTGAVVTDRTIEWISGDPTKATVSNTGLVRTLSPGSVSIGAQVEQRLATATVTILPIPVDSIIANSEYSVALNAANKSFAITLVDANGNQIFGRTVSITSSLPGVAQGGVNAAATIVTIAAFSTGSTNFVLRALDSNGQPEGKTTTVRVVITAPINP